MDFSEHEITDFIIYQLGALGAFAAAEGVRLVHVKPHGALYNLASKDITAAKAIAQAVHDFDSSLIMIGLAGSILVKEGIAMGLVVANEGFPDRAYLPEGQLMPRTQKGAVIHRPEIIAANALRLVKEGLTVNGEKVQIDTLC
jgi:UPF0271 protein